MPLRQMNVERRITGTLNGAVEYHIHYSVRADLVSLPKKADFRAVDLLAAPGAPSEEVFAAVSGAVRAYGRAMAGTDGTHDEHTRFDTLGDDYGIVYRDVPSSGPPNVVTYLLADVRAAPGAPSSGDFDAVVSFLVSYGDAAAGFS